MYPVQQRRTGGRNIEILGLFSILFFSNVSEAKELLQLQWRLWNIWPDSIHVSGPPVRRSLAEFHEPNSSSYRLTDDSRSLRHIEYIPCLVIRESYFVCCQGQSVCVLLQPPRHDLAPSLPLEPPIPPSTLLSFLSCCRYGLIAAQLKAGLSCHSLSCVNTPLNS